MQQFDGLQLAMFSGKGGVGKTTLSCGLARWWAERFPTEQILLLSTDPAHSLGDVLHLEVGDTPRAIADRPNLQVRALDAERLLQTFRTTYGDMLELLVERGSFVQSGDLAPVWDLRWPGLDELMGILEIQRLLRDRVADRIVVDMAPSGHTLNLFGLMTVLDEFLAALDLFQEKHRVISQSFTGRYTPDAADDFLHAMTTELTEGRQLLQSAERTACLVVAIAEPMSLLETQRFLAALESLHITVGGLWVNQIQTDTQTCDRSAEQQRLLNTYLELAGSHPLYRVPQQATEPVGGPALDALMHQVQRCQAPVSVPDAVPVQRPEPIPPGFNDFVTAGRQLILVGGKGGVGKTTVAAAIGWAMAEQHPTAQIRVISIDPAHSLGDAFGQPLTHEVSAITPNLTAQEINRDRILEQFRHDYLWELADMMSGDSDHDTGDTRLTIAYGPEAWRKIVSQSLPGIDELLALLTVMELLESDAQDLIILDTAPTGHLLRFLEMPAALSDWLAWIFKLWIKYQDVVGRTDFMGRLRQLRQRVVLAQKRLRDPQHTEFIGVVQAQAAILAEAQRLTPTLTELGLCQRYLVYNRYEPGQPSLRDRFPDQTLVHLPALPRGVAPLQQIQWAAQLLF